MIRQRPVELLAPARNVECAMAAVDHGADAVYIGASRFGARASAGNSVEDIARLVEYAHTFRVKVYVTVNTILKDEELPETERLVWALYRAGVDALIVQDMALLELDLPPIPLHASTQMDNRTPEKVKFLHGLGFSQVVLARELSLAEIQAVHAACTRGALCQLQRAVLRVAALLRAECQSGRVRPVLPVEVRYGRQRRAYDRTRPPLAFLERHEPG